MNATKIAKNEKKKKIFLSLKVTYLIVLVLFISSFFYFNMIGNAAAQDDNNESDEDEGFWSSNYAMAMIIIIFGISLLLVEPFVPGLFLAIPGSVLVTIGIIGVIAPDLLFSPISLGAGIVAGIIALIIAIKVYKFIAPTKPPTTTVGDSLIGKEGIIMASTDPDHRTKGKVRIGSTQWSAYADSVIPEGTKVEVIASEGVHVKVTRIKSNVRRTKMKEPPES